MRDEEISKARKKRAIKKSVNKVKSLGQMREAVKHDMRPSHTQRALKKLIDIFISNYANSNTSTVVKLFNKEEYLELILFRKHKVKFNEYLKEDKI